MWCNFHGSGFGRPHTCHHCRNSGQAKFGVAVQDLGLLESFDEAVCCRPGLPDVLHVLDQVPAEQCILFTERQEVFRQTPSAQAVKECIEFVELY